MRIPEDLIIPDAKISRYLLVQKARNDKSKFLAQAGFTQENPEALRIAIQAQAVATEAVEDRSNEYGIFYQVEGDLIGAHDVRLSVVTIWLRYYSGLKKVEYFAVEEWGWSKVQT